MTRWEMNDIDRDAIVLELMIDAGLTDAPEIKDSLDALGSFASMPAPEPGAALAAMIGGSASRAVAVTDVAASPGVATLIGGVPGNLPADELARRRRSRRHRPAVIGAAVLTAMGLGVGGVAAASSGFSKGTPDFMQSLISDLAPGWTSAPPSLVPPAPANDSPKVATSPGPLDTPAPAVAPSVPAVPGKAASHKAEDNQSQEGGDGGPGQGTSGTADAPKGANTDPKSEDSQGVLKPVTDTLPKVNTKDVRDGLQQVLQDGQGGPAAGSPRDSLRWILGLAH